MSVKQPEEQKVQEVLQFPSKLEFKQKNLKKLTSEECFTFAKHIKNSDPLNLKFNTPLEAVHEEPVKKLSSQQLSFPKNSTNVSN